MVNRNKRDLLIVSKEEPIDSAALLEELDQIKRVLTPFETLHQIASPCEILDLAKFKKYNQLPKVMKMLESKKKSPFVFIFNRN